MPWSMQFRTKCTNGSFISSKIRRSASISPPCITKATSLPRSRDKSRTSFGKPSNSDENGSIKTFRISSRRPSTILPSVR
jgi:hypothetical protein